MKLKFAFLAVVLSSFSYAQVLSSFEEVVRSVQSAEEKFIKTSSEHMGQRLFYKHKP